VATVQFPDGTTVEAVGIQERRPDKPGRDYGFYLDARWRPTWTADVIEWEDFGLPADAEATADAICNTFRRAKHGARVEVGCIGGLGRTGTVLACMAILAGIAPGQAVHWVRGHYDSAAIETPEQEEWVLWFAGRVSTQAT
jgi:protein-tyrosine phosphatase